jgi:hypothetical protein
MIAEADGVASRLRVSIEWESDGVVEKNGQVG